mgnify:CR=1 FL=1
MCAVLLLFLTQLSDLRKEIFLSSKEYFKKSITVHKHKTFVFNGTLYKRVVGGVSVHSHTNEKNSLLFCLATDHVYVLFFTTTNTCESHSVTSPGLKFPIGVMILVIKQKRNFRKLCVANEAHFLCTISQYEYSLIFLPLFRGRMWNRNCFNLAGHDKLLSNPQIAVSILIESSISPHAISHPR